MKISKTAWLTIGIGVFVIAVASLYVVYQGQVNQRQEAKDTLAEVEGELQTLYIERAALEGELGDVEGELAQWEVEIEQLEQQLAQAIADSGQAKEGFLVSIDGIEYEEILFALAEKSDVGIARLNSGGQSTNTVEGIVYTIAIINMEVHGEVLDILGYIDAIVTDDGFKTVIIEPINIGVPKPLADEQKEGLKDEMREKLMSEALADITTDQIVGFTLESIDEMVGNEFINILTNPEGSGAGDGALDALSIAEMAENIRQKIADSLYIEQEYEELLSGDLAELIAEQIASSVINKVVSSLVGGISGLIVEAGEEGYNYDDLVELLGEDMAQLLGEEIAGGLTGNLSGLLNDYIAGLIEAKMIGSVIVTVEADVEKLMAEQIEEMEMSSASIDLVIYAYPGEGE